MVAEQGSTRIMGIAFIFPGQGTQAAGMGRQLAEQFPEAARMLDRIDEILGFRLSRICFEGPAERLAESVISGLAVFAVSAATLEVVRGFVQPVAFAGYSVGQYAAIYAAGGLSLEDAVRLLRARGQCMERAARENPSTMLSVVGLPAAKAAEFAGRLRDVYVSNYNSPGHVSFACSTKVAPSLEKMIEEHGVLHIERLRVAGGWHSPFMLPAVECLREALAGVRFAAWSGILGDNVSGALFSGPQDLPESLLAHLYSPVRWIEIVRTLKGSGVSRFIEIGFSNQLTQFVRFIDRKAEALSTATIGDIELLKRLCAEHGSH